MADTNPTPSEDSRLTASEFKTKILEPLAQETKVLVDAAYRAGFSRAMYEAKKQENPPTDNKGEVITKANINQEASALANKIKDVKKLYAASLKKKRATGTRKGRRAPIPILVSDELSQFFVNAKLGNIHSVVRDGDKISSSKATKDSLRDKLGFLTTKPKITYTNAEGKRVTVTSPNAITTRSLLTPLFAVYVAENNLANNATVNQGKNPYDVKFVHNKLGADDAMMKTFGDFFKNPGSDKAGKPRPPIDPREFSFSTFMQMIKPYNRNLKAELTKAREAYEVATRDLVSTPAAKRSKAQEDAVKAAANSVAELEGLSALLRSEEVKDELEHEQKLVSDTLAGRNHEHKTSKQYIEMNAERRKAKAAARPKKSPKPKKGPKKAAGEKKKTGVAKAAKATKVAKETKGDEKKAEPKRAGKKPVDV